MTLHRCPYCFAEETTRSNACVVMHACPRRPPGRGRLTAYTIVRAGTPPLPGHGSPASPAESDDAIGSETSTHGLTLSPGEGGPRPAPLMDNGFWPIHTGQVHQP